MSIYIDEKICKGCKLCMYFCPNNVFQMRDKVNDKGFIIPEVVNESKCKKCKLCELACPDLAIWVENLD